MRSTTTSRRTCAPCWARRSPMSRSRCFDVSPSPSTALHNRHGRNPTHPGLTVPVTVAGTVRQVWRQILLRLCQVERIIARAPENLHYFERTGRLRRYAYHVHTEPDRKSTRLNSSHM